MTNGPVAVGVTDTAGSVVSMGVTVAEPGDLTVRDGALFAARKIARSFPAGSASRTIAMQGFDSRYDLPIGDDDHD